MVVLAVVLALIALIALRAAARSATRLVAGTEWGVPPSLADSRIGLRLHRIRTRLVERHPKPAAFVARRLDPRQPAGLLLTLMVLAAIYLIALFSGLTEDVLEAQGTIQSDNAINAALNPWRVEPFVSAFLWITNLGSTPAVVSAVIIATGFLWSQRGARIVIALWVTCLGAVGTTTAGKLLVARHRPDIMLDANAAGWSFPSGHATAAMAVYGFIAYAVARVLPDFRTRFEVAYWAAVLIVLIGFSRVLLGVHYATDVLGGFMVGGFWLLVGIGITETSSVPSVRKP